MNARRTGDWFSTGLPFWLWRLGHPFDALRATLPRWLSASARRKLFRLFRHASRHSSCPTDAQRFLTELSAIAPSMQPRESPLVSILLVTYNHLLLSRLCVESILRFTSSPFEIIVVDNASTDGTAEWLQEESDAGKLRHLRNPENRGFPAAANQAARLASGEVLCFMNNDAVVTPGWLESLLAGLSVPGVGMVGPASNAIANEARVPSRYRTAAEMLSFARSHALRYQRRLLDLPMLAFFCVALRRSTWEQVGPLDERFGLGMFEDDDYCRRLHLLGMRTVLARDAFVHHWQSASFKLIDDDSFVSLYDHNRNLLREKWSGVAARE